MEIYQLTNISGSGFNDGFSLNSNNEQYKDVVYGGSNQYLGIHTIDPMAQFHVMGGFVFRDDLLVRATDFTLPAGHLLLWDPASSMFRSGIFDDGFDSLTEGMYSIGFGRNHLLQSKYSTILGGDEHQILLGAKAATIMGGQNHNVKNQYSVIAGGYNHLINGEWSVILGDLAIKLAAIILQLLVDI